MEVAPCINGHLKGKDQSKRMEVKRLCGNQEVQASTHWLSDNQVEIYDQKEGFNAWKYHFSNSSSQGI